MNWADEPRECTLHVRASNRSRRYRAVLGWWEFHRDASGVWARALAFWGDNRITSSRMRFAIRVREIPFHFVAQSPNARSS